MLKVRNKKVLVMGLGLLGGGESVAKWLISKGAKVTITDLKTRKQLKNTIARIKGKKIVWHLGGHVEEDFKTHDLIVRNPGVPDDSTYLAIAKKSNIPIYNEASLFFEQTKREIIVVTGTRGKSTVSTLICELLKKQYPYTFVAGNRGDVPMFSLTQEAKKNISCPIVLELSSWQVEGLAAHKMSPHIAVLTNLYPDHLNRYKSLADYYKAKSMLFAYQKKGDIAVFNSGNKASVSFAKNIKAKKLWFTINDSLPKGVSGVFKKGDALFYKHEGHIKRVVDLTDVYIKGEHNIENIASAVTVARTYGISVKDIQDTLRTFKGVWGRQQDLGVIAGRRIINDTTASTPEGLSAFIRSYPGAIIIAGGNNKKLTYKKVAGLITKKTVKAVVCLSGSATKELIKELKLVKKTPPVYKAETLEKAVKKAFSLSSAGDVIGLSPGATSFHEFNNEFERGVQFEKYIKKLR